MAIKGRLPNYWDDVSLREVQSVNEKNNCNALHARIHEINLNFLCLVC